MEEWSQCPEKELNKIGRGDNFMMRVLAMLEKPKILLVGDIYNYVFVFRFGWMSTKSTIMTGIHNKILTSS